MAALFVEIRFKGLSNFTKNLIEPISTALGQNELFLKTEALAGWVFGATGLAVLIGSLALIGRICNARHDSGNRKIFSFLVSLCGR